MTPRKEHLMTDTDAQMIEGLASGLARRERCEEDA
jgi:hypothetical protein